MPFCKMCLCVHVHTGLQISYFAMFFFYSDILLWENRGCHSPPYSISMIPMQFPFMLYNIVKQFKHMHTRFNDISVQHYEWQTQVSACSSGVSSVGRVIWGSRYYTHSSILISHAGALRSTVHLHPDGRLFQRLAGTSLEKTETSSLCNNDIDVQHHHSAIASPLK